MKVEGDSPEPETVAVPLLAAVETLQVSEPAAVSASVAKRVGLAHAVGEPSSDIVTETEAPCVMAGAAFAAGAFSDNRRTPDERICEGEFRLVVEPSPSSPLALLPMAWKLPSDFMKRMWYQPAATWTTPEATT